MPKIRTQGVAKREAAGEQSLQYSPPRRQPRPRLQPSPLPRHARPPPQPSPLRSHFQLEGAEHEAGDAEPVVSATPCNGRDDATTPSPSPSPNASTSLSSSPDASQGKSTAYAVFYLKHTTPTAPRLRGDLLKAFIDVRRAMSWINDTSVKRHLFTTVVKDASFVGIAPKNFCTWLVLAEPARKCGTVVRHVYWVEEVDVIV